MPDVFFPKPYNDEQIDICRRLAKADGLVVQGPPGTGKTHTIANLVSHAMATGQRVLVVSRKDAALATLRDQLPAEIRPLAIALLSNERSRSGCGARSICCRCGCASGCGCGAKSVLCGCSKVSAAAGGGG